jgi:tripartite-type tricarboxylate transporter receptor subunit TctC
MKPLYYCGVAWLVYMANMVNAQSYPSKPIRLLVPYAPGNAGDISSRSYAIELGKQLGQQVVVDNRPGASGIIAFDTVARAAPDGHTLAYVATMLVTNPHIYARLPYHTRDIQPIIHTGASPNILLVAPSHAAVSLREMIELARARPGTLSFGSSGVGASSHLVMEMLKLTASINLTHVPYKGSQQALTDVMGGQIHMIFDAIGAAVPHVKAGKVRGLAVSSIKRSPSLPDVPTVDESAVKDFDFTNWGGIATGSGVPRDIVTRLNAELNRVLRLPAVAEPMLARGGVPVGGTPRQFADFLVAESDKVGKIIRAAGIKPNS